LVSAIDFGRLACLPFGLDGEPPETFWKFVRTKSFAGSLQPLDRRFADFHCFVAATALSQGFRLAFPLRGSDPTSGISTAAPFPVA
jgi:hypothetical protein